ncbi:MAG TPA: DNA polymerase III subunit delta [Burkholderiales bacterium]|nr:DNA polymerase III subunit delta [Burkholderiales bacterium]
MRLDSEQLAPHLARGLKSLYAIHGDEPLLALEAADRIRAEARRAGYAVREVLQAEAGFDWGRLAASGSSLSLFGDRRLLELRIPGGKPGVEGAQAIQAYCGNLPPDTLTLVILPKLDRAQQQSAWFGALEAAGVAVAANPVGRAGLPAWIAGRLGMQGHKADADTLQFLADRVEGNLLAAWQEIQKLALLFAPGTLDFAQVREAVLDVARYDVYQVSEAMLTGNAARLARVLEGLRGEGEGTPLLLWVMAEDIRALSRMMEGLRQGRPVSALLRESRVWGPRQDAMQRALRRLSPAQVGDALLHAAEIDKAIKGLKSRDVWDELLQLGLRFCGPAASPKRAVGG